MRAARFGFGVVYLIMGGFCAVGLVQLLTTPGPAGTDRSWTVLLTSMIFLVSAFGLVVVVAAPWIQRRRPGPELTRAPSGRPATGFPRSRFRVVLQVAFMVVAAGWWAAVAFVLLRDGEPAWAGAAAVVSVGALWAVLRVATGQVRPGGLWLTPSGVEYRKDALTWSVSWSDVVGVHEDPAVVSPLAEPREVLMPSEPVLVRLSSGATARITGPRWAQRQSPPGWLRVDSYHLAGGAPLIVETIRQCLNYPWAREHLGTAHSLPRRPHHQNNV